MSYERQDSTKRKKLSELITSMSPIVQESKQLNLALEELLKEKQALDNNLNKRSFIGLST